MSDKATEITVPAASAAAAAWFFENTLDVFVAVQGIVVRATNGRWKRVTGWDPKETPNRSFFDSVHPADADAARPIIAELPPLERIVLDLRLLAASGGWVAMETQVIRGDADWFLMILRDVTVERQRELDAEEAVQTAVMLQEVAGVTIWRFNPQTDEYDIDPDFTRHGRAMRPFNRRTGADMRAEVHRDDRARLLAAWQDSIETGVGRVLTYRTRGPDGWHTIRGTWRGVRRLASGQWELLGIAQDVTHLRAKPGRRAR